MNSAAGLRNSVVACGLRRTLIVLFVGIMLIPTGCSWFKKKKTTTDMEGATTTTQTPVRPGEAAPPEMEAQPQGPRPGDLQPFPEMKLIYFDYDKSEIRPDQLAQLEANLQYLLNHPQDKVFITGHCDERGTIEYNLVLGEKRAMAVRQYLVRGGVDPNRIGTQSRGEEEPVALGHDESSWSKNRRCEFQRMF